MNDKYVCLLLGSNIHPEKNIPKALELLRQNFSIGRISPVWESPPFRTVGANFLNVAVVLINSLDPMINLRKKLREIEKSLGRVRSSDKYAPRTIDIDIVIFDAAPLDDDLWQLAHVAVPVSAIWPCLKYPETGETLAIIANRLRNISDIKLRLDILKENKINDFNNLLCSADNLGKIN
jgi:2-amino-4-hydroxy-6-hydroxymethyldihydropteridine diphosphokinase